MRAKLKKHITNSVVLRKKILNILKYAAFTLLGVLLFWLVYRDQDFTKIWETLKNDVNYWWVGLALFFGLLSHISRTLRWKIALEPLNEKPKTINAFCAVMVSYFMNLLLPRMGEFIRCGLLSKYEKITFSKLLGTVVTERIVDVIMVVLIFCLTLVLEFDKIMDFGSANPEIVEKLQALIKSPFLWSAFIIAIAGLAFYLWRNKKRGKKNKFESLFLEFFQGIKSVLAMKRYKEYIAHTIFIWLMYYSMIYVTFFSLGFTSNLSPVAALTTFILSSFAMLAPVQGGIGAWHFMAEKALGLYGVESANGKIFALLAHSSTNLMVVLLGAICIILIPIINRKYNSKGMHEKN